MSRTKDFYHDSINEMLHDRSQDANLEELTRKDTIAAINTELAKRNAARTEAARLTRKARLAVRFGRAA
jgi:hypothetical protein